jgi:omega-hydroxy-beta-dihydromenaquinone-9 sulfotransferase
MADGGSGSFERPADATGGQGRLTESLCVFGTGRSGTTIFLNVLGTHPDLAWVSNFIERYPRYPQLALLSRINRLSSTLGPDSKLSRFLPHPAESLASMRLTAGGLFQVPRELKRSELPAEVIQTVRAYHETILTYHGRHRLLLKHTGFPRFEFWRQVLGMPRFIHVLRDGRAVAYSLMRVQWWDGTMKSWWWGRMPDHYMTEYENSGRRPSVLAAIVWKYLLDIYEEQVSANPWVRLKVVRFDSFTRDPISELREVAEFGNLAFPARFQRAIAKFKLRNADLGWQRGLGRVDLESIERVLEAHLNKYGFS